MKDKCYIITYQSANDSTSLLAAIKSYGTWAKITENTWAVVTEDSAKNIRDYLKSFLEDGGRIFVIKSGVEAAWSKVICKNEWLKNNL